MKKQAECIAIYDWADFLNLSAWLAFTEGLFAEQAYTPDVITAQREGEKPGRIRISELRSQVERGTGWNAIDLSVTAPGYKQLVFGWRSCAAIVLSPKKTAIAAWEAGSLDTKNVLIQMSSLFGPAYGIGFRRDFAKGPDLFAYGMVAGLGYSGQDKVEAERIGKWLRERNNLNRHSRGMLRDIFPYNLLAKAHLEWQVDGHTLASWIATSPGRGELRILNAHQAIWTVPEAGIAEIRHELTKSNMIICDAADSLGR